MSETHFGMRSNSANSLAVAVTTPSQARRSRREGVETGRARPTGPTYGQGTVRTTNALAEIRAVAKAIVVRKSVARKGIRVRVPVIPNRFALFYAGFRRYSRSADRRFVLTRVLVVLRCQHAVRREVLEVAIISRKAVPPRALVHEPARFVEASRCYVVGSDFKP